MTVVLFYVVSHSLRHFISVFEMIIYVTGIVIFFKCTPIYIKIIISKIQITEQMTLTQANVLFF